MSRLPNAPLIEVIFELRWNQMGSEDQYLQGDLYPKIQDQYPAREVVNQLVATPLPITTLLHRFWSGRNESGQFEYPLVQIGQGLVTVNTIDAKYSWKEYEGSIVDVLNKLETVFPLKRKQSVRLALQYIDLIRFDFESQDVYPFLRDKLHLNVSQEFYKSQGVSKNIQLALFYDNELGPLTINFNRGQSQTGEQGIGIQTTLQSHEIKPDIESIRQWLSKAHDLTSKLFKDMTAGELQKNFASK